MQKLNVDIGRVVLIERRNASDILYLDLNKELVLKVLPADHVWKNSMCLKVDCPKGTGKDFAKALNVDIDEVISQP